MSYWSKLSMKDKADVMRLFLDKGISDLDTIRREYNIFAEGGDTNDNDLVDWIIREEGFNSKPENIGDGKITLGSGLTDKKWHDLYRKRGNKWSAEDNRMAVAEEVANRRKWAEKNIPNWNTLPDSAQKALLSYKYNYNFTSANSPKLFQALADSNLYEAAKQMDATSKNPKFKKGLMDRRKREQEWFLSDVTGNAAPTQAIPVQTPTTIDISMPSITEPAVSTAVRNNYVPATTTPYNRGSNMRRGFESVADFNRMMDTTSLQNNPLPEYPFPISYADGGKIHIDPSKKGTFTAAASRHGMGVQEFASRVLANKENYSPAMVKKANFARNASKWHGFGGNLFDGTTENSQQMVNPYRPNGGFYYVNSEGQPVNPTTRDIIELPGVVVAADKNSPSWYNRTTVGGFDENGFHESWEGIQPLVMSDSEWNRSHSANALQTMDPYGEIPWNAAAMAVGFLAPELAYPYIVKGVQLPFKIAEKVAIPATKWPMGRTTPKITAENAASITPEQWTAAQNAAIARGDMAEAQRLRDLHFQVSAPNTKVVDINGNPQLVIHKTPNDFTVFDNSRSVGELNWAATPKAFEGENGVFATGAGTNPKEMRLYVNMKNPHYPTIDEGMSPAFINEGEDGILGIVDKDMADFYKSASDAGEGFNMSLGVDNPYALKSANAVTYDNNGIRIPLGLRDNFNINDIRYGLLPFGIGLTGYGLWRGNK